MSVQGRAELRALLERHGLRPRKSLGQHFLADPNLVRKIVATAGVRPGSRVVEIGAGTGTLTAALADAGATVVAYEVDHALSPVLAEMVGDRPTVEIRYADAAAIDLQAELGEGPWTMVANLPYHVGTPILLDTLRRVPEVMRMVVMVQTEVAERLVARAGEDAYGLPSVVVGLHADAHIAFRVPPQVFVPPPQVESAVVEVERRPAHPRAERAIELAATAFGQRRKMLRRSLAAVVTEADLARAQLDPTTRPEQIAPEEWLALAEAVDG